MYSSLAKCAQSADSAFIVLFTSSSDVYKMLFKPKSKMAQYQGPKIDKPNKYFLNYLAPYTTKDNLTKALDVMKEIEKKSENPHFWCYNAFEKYKNAFLDAQIIFKHADQHQGRYLLGQAAKNFLKSRNTWNDTVGLFSMYTSFSDAPLKMGQKVEATKALMDCKSIFDQFNMDSMLFKVQWATKHTLYKCYFEYYRHPLVLHGSKMITNGFFMLTGALKSNVVPSTTFLLLFLEVIDETIKVRAFRQSNYLLRAFQVFKEANKNKQEQDLTADLIDSETIPTLECMVQLNYAKLMLKILMTMIAKAGVEEKLSQGINLNKQEKNSIKVLQDCHTFDNVQVPEGDKMLDGLLKNEDEVYLVHKQIQKTIKVVNADFHENIREDRDRCLAELKDTEEFFNIFQH